MIDIYVLATFRVVNPESKKHQQESTKKTLVFLKEPFVGWFYRENGGKVGGGGLF